jgi:hypothetical protein
VLQPISGCAGLIPGQRHDCESAEARGGERFEAVVRLPVRMIGARHALIERAHDCGSAPEAELRFERCNYLRSFEKRVMLLS